MRNTLYPIRRTRIPPKETAEPKSHKIDSELPPFAGTMLQSFCRQIAFCSSPEHLCASCLSRLPRHCDSRSPLPPNEAEIPRSVERIGLPVNESNLYAGAVSHRAGD